MKPSIFVILGCAALAGCADRTVQTQPFTTQVPFVAAQPGAPSAQPGESLPPLPPFRLAPGLPAPIGPQPAPRIESMEVQATGLRASVAVKWLFDPTPQVYGRVSGAGYQVIAIPYGSSIVRVETVCGHAVQVTWPTIVNAVYALEFSNDCKTWMPAGLEVTGNGQPYTFTSSARTGLRFYRVKQT